MRFFLKSFLSILLAANLINSTFNVPTANADILGNVVFIGDSITEGDGTPSSGVAADGYTWRYNLWQRFVDNTVDHQFVGTRTLQHEPPIGGFIYPDYNGESFTNAHEAIWGTTAQERNFNIGNRLNTLATNGETPNTAFIFVGGNGVSSGPTNSSNITNITSDISSIIDKLQGETAGVSGNSDVNIYLMSTLPRFSSNGQPDSRNANGFTALNMAMQNLADNQDTLTSTVEYLDLFELMNDPAFYYDGIHPNSAGADRIGNAVFSQITSVPEPSGLMVGLFSLLTFALRRKRQS